MSDIASGLLLQLKDYEKCNDGLAIKIKKTILEPFQVDLNRPESARRPPTTTKFKQMATQLAPIAMRIVNQNIETLVGLKRATLSTGDYTIAVNCLLDTSFYALTALRHMNTYTALKPLDIEKATSNLICKMVELGEHQRALDEIRKFRVLLAGIAKVQLNPKSLPATVIDSTQKNIVKGGLTESLPNSSSFAKNNTTDIPEFMIKNQWENEMLKEYQDLFQFPLDASINDRTMILLVLAYQMNTIRSWCEINEGALSKYVPYFLERSGSFIEWCKHLLKIDQTTAKKQLDTLHKLLYKATNRLPSSEEASFHSYHIQVFALKALTISGSTSLQSIMDRLVVIGTTYEKATSQVMYTYVQKCCNEFLENINLDIKNLGLMDSYFVLCEYYAYISRKAKSYKGAFYAYKFMIRPLRHVIENPSTCSFYHAAYAANAKLALGSVQMDKIVLDNTFADISTTLNESISCLRIVSNLTETMQGEHAEQALYNLCKSIGSFLQSAKRLFQYISDTRQSRSPSAGKDFGQWNGLVAYLNGVLQQCSETLPTNLCFTKTSKRSISQSDIIVSFIDIMILLSRMQFDVQNQDSYQLAYEYLSTAEQMCAEKRFNTGYRWLSGAYYSLGTAMIKTDDYPHAIYPLRKSSSLLEKDVDRANTEEGKLQLCKRYEVLGLCCHKNKDYEDSIKAYRLALKRIPLTTIRKFVRQSDTTAVSTIIEREILIPKLMDRFLRAAVTDPDMVSIQFASEFVNMTGLDILEQCIIYECELKVWHTLSLKMNVAKYQMAIVKKLLQVYDPYQHPIRRARVLLSQVRIERSKPSSDREANVKSALDCAQKAHELLKVQVYGKDSNLLSYRRYYLALSMSWIAICERELKEQAPSVFASCLQQWGILLKKIAPIYHSKPSSKLDIQQVFDEIDDLDQFYDHVRMLADLFAVTGEPIYRISALRTLLKLNNGLRDVQVDHISDSLIYICTIGKIYCELGYTGKASVEFNHAKKLMLNYNCSNLAQVFYRIHYAQYLTYIDDFETSKEVFDGTKAIWQHISSVSNKDPLTTVKSYTSRCMLLADVYTAQSMILARIDSLDRAIDHATSALGLLNKCIKVIQKSEKERQPSASNELEDPFMPTIRQEEAAKVVYRESQWILAQKISLLLQNLAHLYMTKGSWNEAQYFVKQGPLLAEKVNSAALFFESHLSASTYYLKYGDLDRSQEELEAASGLELNGQYHILDEVKLKIHMANLALANGYSDISLEAYTEAEYLLAQLTTSSYISNLEHLVDIKEGTENDMEASDKYECLPLQKTQNLIILKKAIALSDKGYLQEAVDLLETIEESGTAIADEVELYAILSRFKLAMIRQEVKRQPESNVLYRESTSLPAMKTQAARGTMIKKTAINQDLLVIRDTLANTLERMLEAKSIGWAREATPIIQFLCSNSGFSMFLKNHLSSQSRALANNYALLESYYTSMANGINMRREMQNSLRIKLNPAYLCLPSDTEWPINEEAEGSKRNPRWLQAHLNTLVELYREENDLSDKEFQDKFINILPPHWTVCSLTMDVDNKDLYMTRLRTNEEPFVVKLPLNRTKHRPNNTYPPTMQYEDAVSELRDIIQASDDTIHNSGNCTQPAQVEAWWSTRKDLDNRLKILLDNIENQWLSGFKAMLTGRCHEHKEELRKFQKSINEVIFKCVNQATGTKKQVELNLTFCRMVLRLGQLPNVRDIEDVIYFSLACYEAQGVPIDYSRIDLKKLMDQIRLLNSRYHEKSNMAGINVTKNIPNDHLILILDKHLQMLPLESMPLLRPQSVSRLPCLSFLRDRILHVRAYNGRTAFNDFGMIATDQWTDLSISQNNAYYVLNPGGDLKDTQNEFESLFKSVRGWDGVIQRKPLELQMKEALQSRDLYMYFGHSAGQAFMRGTTVRQLPTCAVSLLMGCSSGILETHGEFDPYGYVLNYLLAGSPAVVANLWDVTDRSIDRLTKYMLNAWGMLKQTNQNKSLVQAVTESRSKCKLSYLIGAAPVVYGIPVYLEPYSA